MITEKRVKPHLPVFVATLLALCLFSACASNAPADDPAVASDPNSVSVSFGEVTTKVDLAALATQSDSPFGYNYQRVSNGVKNCVAATDNYVALIEVLDAAGAPWEPGCSLEFLVWDSDRSEAVPYTNTAGFEFSYANIPEEGYFFGDVVATGTAMEGAAEAVPAVLALSTATGEIPEGFTAQVYSAELSYAGSSTEQAPRLLFGYPQDSIDASDDPNAPGALDVLAPSDAEAGTQNPDRNPTYRGSYRFPSNIVEIIVVSPDSPYHPTAPEAPEAPEDQSASASSAEEYSVQFDPADGDSLLTDFNNNDTFRTLWALAHSVSLNINHEQRHVGLVVQTETADLQTACKLGEALARSLSFHARVFAPDGTQLPDERGTYGPLYLAYSLSITVNSSATAAGSATATAPDTSAAPFTIDATLPAGGTILEWQ